MIVRIFLLSLVLLNLCVAGDYKRLEIGGSFERLSPSSYGEWKSVEIKLFHRPREDFTYFLGTSGFSRKEGDATLFLGGGYKDWTNWLYTYSAISFGTSSDYLPKYRLDHEFNVKLGERKNIVPALSLSYIKYHNVHRDFVLGFGFTLYQEGWNFTYRHFINRSDPGNVTSSSNLFSLGIGREKLSWTYVDFSFGKQAYLATYFANPQEVRQKSIYAALKHRHWITDSFGIMGEVSYLKLRGGYEKYGLGVGAFKEF